MSDDVSVHVDDKNGAIAHARVAQTPEQAVDRNYRREHSCELAVGKQRHGHDQRGAVVLSYSERLADVVEPLNAGGKSSLERHADEGIGIRAETSGRFALRLGIDGGHVKNIGIVLDEI